MAVYTNQHINNLYHSTIIQKSANRQDPTCDHFVTMEIMVVSQHIITDGTEMVQVTLLRKTLASSP